jgi:hypothetical protein
MLIQNSEACYIYPNRALIRVNAEMIRSYNRAVYEYMILRSMVVVLLKN